MVLTISIINPVVLPNEVLSRAGNLLPSRFHSMFRGVTNEHIRIIYSYEYTTKDCILKNNESGSFNDSTTLIERQGWIRSVKRNRQQVPLISHDKRETYKSKNRNHSSNDSYRNIYIVGNRLLDKQDITRYYNISGIFRGE